MKYIWIIMLAILYLFWLFAVIVDIKHAIEYCKEMYSERLFFNVLNNLEELTWGFIIGHIVALFIASLLKFLNVY